MTASTSTLTLLDLFQFSEAARGLSASKWLAELRRCGPISPDDIPALKAALARRFDAMKQASSAEAQRRGYQFEHLLTHLLALEGLDPWPPFYVNPPETTENAEVVRSPRGRRSGGEQVDGYFGIDGRQFLLEAKWQSSALPVSTLYEFRGRVDGRLAGTIGLFLSASGFAENAEYTLLSGKELNVLLADLGDLEAVMLEGNSFREMMRVKMREAARRGVAFWSYKTFLDEREA